MKGKLHKARDFYAGVLFILFGSYAVLGARSYPIGTSSRMGPGYFPTFLGLLLLLFGLISLGRAVWVNRESVAAFGYRPLVLVLAAIMIFALAVNSLGLLVATLALVFISSIGGWEFRLKETAVLYIVLAALAVGVFVLGLRLPFKVWPF